MKTQIKRVLIIGAGPSGLSLLRALKKQSINLTESLQIVCCQKQSQWGGQWNYFAKQKFDKNGIPIPTTNQYLWTNAPKQCFEYPDYSFDNHFNGQQKPSYLTRFQLRDYLLKRFELANIKDLISYETMVSNIHFLSQKRKFSVDVQNLRLKHKTVQLFDFVVVASGHYAKPNRPKIDGIENFSGKLLHSIQIKDYADYKGQNILVIGTGLSAEDTVLQCYKYGAKSITVTYRTNPMSSKIPQQIEQFPLMTKIQGNTVFFPNGAQRNFDTIIMCTGYVHNFSFLEKQLQIQNSKSLWSDELCLGVVSLNNPQLMFIGMQTQYFSLVMFDIQGHFIKDIIVGKIPIPEINNMKDQAQKRSQQLQKIKSSTSLMCFMGNYLKDLMRMCNYQGYNIEQVMELYRQLASHKQQNVLTFRENIFKSAVSGKWSIMKKKTWLQSGNTFQIGQDEVQNENIQHKQHFYEVNPNQIGQLQVLIS